MELKGTPYAVGQFEGICDELVKQGMAELVKYKKDPNSKSFTNVYNIYIGNEGWCVKAKFWYNIASDHASIELSSEGIELLLDATTVVSLMSKLGQRVSKNGKGLNMTELETLLKKALVAMTGKEDKIELVP